MGWRGFDCPVCRCGAWNGSFLKPSLSSPPLSLSSSSPPASSRYFCCRQVRFDVTMTVSSDVCKGQTGIVNRTVELAAQGLNEKLTVNLAIICDCECERPHMEVRLLVCESSVSMAEHLPYHTSVCPSVNRMWQKICRRTENIMPKNTLQRTSLWHVTCWTSVMWWRTPCLSVNHL